MSRMINLRFAVVAGFLLLCGLLGAACSGSNGPQKTANENIAGANAEISAHNIFLNRARESYDRARARIESGSAPSSQKVSLTDAQTSVRKARLHLQKARSSLQRVQNLDVRAPVKSYARTLSGAMETQIKAEGREAEFYQVLEDDPSLGSHRRQAKNLLREIGSGYSEAREEYRKAQNLADSNPKLLKPASRTK